MNTGIIIPIITGSGGGGTMSEGSEKMFMGIGVLFLALWICTSIYTIVKYLIIRKDLSEYDTFWGYYFMEDPVLITGFHCFMTVIGVIGLICFIGSMIGKLL